MFSAFYKSFISTASIYSLSKFKNQQNKIAWLIVTTKEIIVLYAENGNVIYKLLNISENGGNQQ